MKFDNLIFSIAYNMTGDYETAKDIVQDITLKFLENPIHVSIEDERNYVIRTTINHCINTQKRNQRMQYFGLWLPEPIAEKNAISYSDSKYEKFNLLSYELSFLMEQLSQLERAVFILRNAFDFSHNEIAKALNITSANSRQILTRSIKKVGNLKHEPKDTSRELGIPKQFVKLIMEGDTESLVALFNEEISLVSDGGGKVPAITKPIFGKENVAHFFIKLGIAGNKLHPEFSYTKILSHPAIVISLNKQVIDIIILSVHSNKVSQLFAILNPDKLESFKKSFAFLSHN